MGEQNDGFLKAERMQLYPMRRPGKESLPFLTHYCMELKKICADHTHKFGKVLIVRSKDQIWKDEQQLRIIKPPENNYLLLIHIWTNEMARIDL